MVQTTGVSFWNNSDSVAGDAPSDGSLGTVGANASGVGVVDNRLFVTQGDATVALAAYDNADGLASGQVADVTLGAAAFGGSAPATVHQIRGDLAGDLWIAWGGTGSISRFEGAATLGPGATARAEFTHMWSQIMSMAYDPLSDRLFGGQVSGAGILAFNDAATAVGVTSSDFTLFDSAAAGTALNPWTMAISANRLYVGSVAGSNFVYIWDDISSVTGATTSTAELGLASDLDQVFDLSVHRDVLVATVTDAPTRYAVNLYVGASAITGDLTPTQAITDADYPDLVLPQQAWLDVFDTLYVRMSDRIMVFANATTSPSLIANIVTDIGTARFMVVMECSPNVACPGAGVCINGVCE